MLKLRWQEFCPKMETLWHTSSVPGFEADPKKIFSEVGFLSRFFFSCCWRFVESVNQLLFVFVSKSSKKTIVNFRIISRKVTKAICASSKFHDVPMSLSFLFRWTIFFVWKNLLDLLTADLCLLPAPIQRARLVGSSVLHLVCMSKLNRTSDGPLTSGQHNTLLYDCKTLFIVSNPLGLSLKLVFIDFRMV